MSQLLEGGLVERERELEVIEHAVGAVAGNSGSVLYVEGPAGQGKTALLRAVRAAAAAADVPALTGVGAEIERDFAFGVVRQLLEPELRSAGEERRAELFRDGAEHARSVFGLGGAADADASFTRLHGLYSLTANLAAARPLAIVVDDLHWVDAPSLRFLDVLARRIEDLPILMALGARPAEPGASQDLLDGLASGPATTLLRPRVLSTEAVGRLLADALAEEAEPPFVAAATEMTAGNPLLISELLRSLAEDGFKGRAGEVDRLRRSVPSTLTRSVVARLRRLAPNALAVARALAVLGERARTPEIAALANVPEAAVAEAHAALARAGLLDAKDLRFLHPLVREAVHADLVSTEQAQWHARAAVLARESGREPADVAAHLLVSEPAGHEWAVDALSSAGCDALRAGAPDVALRYLSRAMLEPPAPHQRQSLLLDLGRAEARMGSCDPVAHLEEAAAGPDVHFARQARRLLAKVLVLQDRAPEGADVLREALAVAREATPEWAAEIEDDLIDVLAQHGTLPEEYWARLATPGDEEGSPTLLSHLAFTRAISGAPAAEVLRLARRALASSTPDGEARFTHYYAIEALTIVEAADEAAAALRAAAELSKRFGGRVVSGPLTYMPSGFAAWERAFGDLRHAEELARYGYDLMSSAGADNYAHSLLATLGVILLDRGRIAEAVAIMEALPARETGAGLKETHAHRARVRLLQHRYEEALEEIETELELERRRGWKIGNRGASRTLHVHILAGLGRIDEARAAAAVEIATSQRRGVAGAEAQARLSLAVTLDGPEAIQELRAAVEAARRSPALKLRAHALLELGSALRRAGERAEARPLLTEARDYAHRCGATAAEERAHEELLVAGGRPQRVALSGLESLTAAERRVADLAAQGLRNKEIAETLFVTLKTVEVHLGRVYAKLGIQGRSQLATALAEPR